MKWLIALICLASGATAGLQNQVQQQKDVNFLAGKRLTVTVDYAQTKGAILTQTAVAKITATMSPTPDVKSTKTPTATLSPSPKAG